MRRYKLIDDDYGVYIKGKIYDEDYKDSSSSSASVKELVALFPHDWEEIKEEFSLPEKWCIKVNAYNLAIVGKWFNENSQTTAHDYHKYLGYLHFPKFDNWMHHSVKTK